MLIIIKKVIKTLLAANFYSSALVLVGGGLLSISGSYSFFAFNDDFYGALDGSLRMMMFYLAVTEMIIFVYCLAVGSFRAMLFVGFFLVLTIGSLEFYGEVNGVTIDESLPVFFLYTGISHIGYGLSVILGRPQS